MPWPCAWPSGEKYIKGLDEVGASGSHLRLSRLAGVFRRMVTSFDFSFIARKLSGPSGALVDFDYFLWQLETTT
jgi:hypothetical protein